ncbi:NAD(P)H-dependent oxidoreductase [uncultured Clostridium sp.]|uniref:FMN-dependent NADH-azoreductase n=1 Tax=uncultured Clostridium sp. TaxID=59620 RepID=UPI0026179FD1|nr:NAD(P)H-dependent oxidoreductase [uncultured Clostridium sp.]
MKLLYIIVNSKNEEDSSSRLVSRKLVEEVMANHECDLEEINLYEEELPELNAKYFSGKNCLIEECDELSKEEKADVEQIKKLANQFAEADAYVIAAPLWSMSFPAPLKQYIDCVVSNGITIEISESGCKGLLEGDRKMIYVQASGGPINLITKGEMCQGIDYVEGIMEHLGIKKFEKLLIDGTGFTEESKRAAEEKAVEKIPHILRSFK